MYRIDALLPRAFIDEQERLRARVREGEIEAQILTQSAQMDLMNLRCVQICLIRIQQVSFSIR